MCLCRCKVGGGRHQVSSPPLLALKPPPSSGCMGGKLALAAGSSWAVLLVGDPPYGQCMDSQGQQARAGLCLLASATQQRGGQGGFKFCRRTCSDEAVSHQCSTGPNAFLFISVQLPWIYLSLLLIPAGWLLNS